MKQQWASQKDSNIVTAPPQTGISSGLYPHPPPQIHTQQDIVGVGAISQKKGAAKKEQTSIDTLKKKSPHQVDPSQSNTHDSSKKKQYGTGGGGAAASGTGATLIMKFLQANTEQPQNFQRNNQNGSGVQMSQMCSEYTAGDIGLEEIKVGIQQYAEPPSLSRYPNEDLYFAAPPNNRGKSGVYMNNQLAGYIGGEGARGGENSRGGNQQRENGQRKAQFDAHDFQRGSTRGFYRLDEKYVNEDPPQHSSMMNEELDNSSSKLLNGEYDNEYFYEKQEDPQKIRAAAPQQDNISKKSKEHLQQKKQSKHFQKMQNNVGNLSRGGQTTNKFAQDPNRTESNAILANVRQQKLPGQQSNGTNPDASRSNDRQRNKSSYAPHGNDASIISKSSNETLAFNKGGGFANRSGDNKTLLSVLGGGQVTSLQHGDLKNNQPTQGGPGAGSKNGSTKQQKRKTTMPLTQGLIGYGGAGPQLALIGGIGPGGGHSFRSNHQLNMQLGYPSDALNSREVLTNKFKNLGQQKNISTYNNQAGLLQGVSIPFGAVAAMSLNNQYLPKMQKFQSTIERQLYPAGGPAPVAAIYREQSSPSTSSIITSSHSLSSSSSKERNNRKKTLKKGAARRNLRDKQPPGTGSLKQMTKKHTFTSTTRKKFQRQFQNSQPIQVVHRRQSISPLTNQSQFIEYYSNRMKENLKNLVDKRYTENNVKEDEESSSSSYANQTRSNNQPLDVGVFHKVETSSLRSSIESHRNKRSFTMIPGGLTDDNGGFGGENTGDTRKPGGEGEGGEKGQEGGVEEPQQEKEPEKTGISLLAQILIKAREERARKEHEELMKNEALIISKLETKKQQKPPEKSFGHKIGIFLKRFIIYTDSQFIAMWNILITSLVLITCVYSPYSLAFATEFSIKLVVMDNFINAVFFLDIFVNLFSAYQDTDFKVVDNPKLIAIKYLKSWFLVDLVSIVPFDLFIYGQNNHLYGFNKISKLYRLVRVTRISRMFKILHAHNHFIRMVTDYIKIGDGARRLLFLALILILLQHVVACLWIFIAYFNWNNRKNWIFAYDFVDLEDWELYIMSFYFTVTTIMTVGYGDITPKSVPEWILCIILMLVGVVSFSFATGAISSIISNQDSAAAKLKEKMTTLESIQQEYNIEEGLFNRIVKAVKYDHHQNSKDVHEFMEELPTKLRIELAMAIHKKMYSGIKFFQNRDNSFIAWIGTFLRPINIQELDFIYKEGEEITEIYFLVQGTAGYVLPRYNNKLYFAIKQGEHFGHVDLANDKEYLKNHKTGKKKKKKNQPVVVLVRMFTVQAQENCDLLTMTLEDLDKMNVEFPPLAKELMDDAAEKLNKEVGTKINAIREQELLISKKSSDLKSKFSAAFLSGLHRTLQIVETEKQQQESAAAAASVNQAQNKSGLQRQTTLSNIQRGKTTVNRNATIKTPKSHVYSGLKSDALSNNQGDEGDATGRNNGVKDSFCGTMNEFDAKGTRQSAMFDSNDATPLKNKQLAAMKREALDERKVSFKVDTEISEVLEEDNEDEGGENELDLSGKGRKNGGNYSGANSHGSRANGASGPGQFEEIRSGAISPYQEDTSSDEYDEEYDNEDEMDSDESDENLILLNEIKHTISRMFRKIERVDRQMKHSREEQRNMHIELQNLAMAHNQMQSHFAMQQQLLMAQGYYQGQEDEPSQIQEQDEEDEDELQTEQDITDGEEGGEDQQQDDGQHEGEEEEGEGEYGNNDYGDDQDQQSREGNGEEEDDEQ